MGPTLGAKEFLSPLSRLPGATRGGFGNLEFIRGDGDRAHFVTKYMSAAINENTTNPTEHTTHQIRVNGEI